MRPHRREKVESLIQRELSAILAREVEFPESSLVTISNVDVTTDLGEAKVGISVIPNKSVKRVMEILTKLRGVIQTLLTRKLNIKPMPHISFEIDRGSENTARVEKLLRDAGEV
jgi:ribosome-binding factor A